MASKAELPGNFFRTVIESGYVSQMNRMVDEIRSETSPIRFLYSNDVEMLEDFCDTVQVFYLITGWKKVLPGINEPVGIARCSDSHVSVECENVYIV